MSYCRFSNSDAYMFHHCDGYITCMGCGIAPITRMPKRRFQEPKFYKRSDALKHLERHLASGDKIPDRAFLRLKEEIENEGDFIHLKIKNKRAPVKRRKLFKKRIKPLSITRRVVLNRTVKLLKVDW